MGTAALGCPVERSSTALLFIAAPIESIHDEPFLNRRCYSLKLLFSEMDARIL